MNGGAARRAFLSLGSNLGDRVAHLATARGALAALLGTEIVAASRVYETLPQDEPDQPCFLNQVVCIETTLEPYELLAIVQGIEAAAGRVRETRFGPRTLDIDILLYEGVELAGDVLTIPHLRMMRRAFVLVPLLEIWSWARGMPPLDIVAAAQVTGYVQEVRLYEPDWD